GLERITGQLHTSGVVLNDEYLLFSHLLIRLSTFGACRADLNDPFATFLSVTCYENGKEK
ncbi:MAG TPA: hypothetical protein VFA32_03160, partial [Dehalococcoidia bacterium]|nr:hypothetical protein [Dehalococcoidia bacterium]